ncbi:DoxX-like family protein [Leptospira gomenensis]|uniref:DoxX-like family protein n=1 Tax=Leptospira gomenensis TaxID=2484974 RepID=A0A5F1Y9T8_9LEPT|nr:MauE/DoxX family redox-associated membrane protein [Leptospira gomenensis]TGK32713.1 DoxX-like family protein [Leptospira gomenensis]TGK36860.1 DoxX-like family protein [Leptospira gomenensis]TGK39936.1 DoxX-like family protein [Leptospira gomenensis]TGK58071.1 DoxX-like family protein [Leptospira gomenensis]
MSESIIVSLYFMATLYVLAGILHFVLPKFYLRIIPPYIPYPKFVVYLSGLIEIILGAALLFPETRRLGAWGIILLLIAVFPANIYHFQSRRKKDPPKWVLLLRLPLQFALIYWAYLFV